jgi:hypothetical protein
MSDLETIKLIDVQHASLDPKGELVDNFWIVDTLLDIIKQLEATHEAAYRVVNNEKSVQDQRIVQLEDEVDTLEYILKDCNCRQRGKT